MVGWWHAENSFADEFGTMDSQGERRREARWRSPPGASEQCVRLQRQRHLYVTIPDSSDLDAIATAGVVTMDAWIDATALGGRILDKITAGGADEYMLDTRSAGSFG